MPRTQMLPKPVAALLCTAPALAQTLFPTEQQITQSPATDQTAVGDLNGDGFQDLVLFSSDEQAVKLMAGDGSGAYGTPEVLSFWQSPGSEVRLMDLDRDGLMDMLLTARGVDETVLRWVRQTGELAFEITEVLRFDRTSEEPQLGDISMGAGLHAMVVERQGLGIEVYRWNGTTFNASPIMIPFTNPRHTRVLDVNDDGQDDVAAFDQGVQRWRYSSYLGGDQFSTPRSFLPIQVVRSEEVHFADFDGDGDSDLVALADNDPTKYFLFERLASGAFGPPIERFASNWISDFRMDVRDLDGDGAPDLQVWVAEGFAGGSSTTYQASWIKNLGGFQFAPHQELGGIPFADLTGDGGIDALYNGGTPLYRVGDGVPPANLYSSTVLLGRALSVVTRPRALDADGDGDLEPVLDRSSGDIVVFDNLGGLNFAQFEDRDGIPAPLEVIAEADFVGDAELDILAFGSPNGALVIRRGISPGVYAPPVVISSALDGEPYPLDVDGDGDLDILQEQAFGPGSNVFFIENSGIGNQFPRRITISFQEGASQPIPMDVDGDGSPELLTFESSLGRIGLRQNLGGGDFGPPAPLTAVAPTFRVDQAVDFDGDGDLDLVGRVFPNAYWSENLGQGNFGPIQEISADATRPRLLDLDGNGLIDVVVDLRAEYRLQTSPGILGDSERMAPGLPAPFVRDFADFDGDGDPDAWLSVPSGAHYVVENIATPPTGFTADVCATAVPNSSGLPGELRAYGSDSASATDLVLSAVQLPPHQFGFFVGSREVGPPAPVAGSSGSICLRGSIGRYLGPGQVQSSGPPGSFSIALDPTALITGSGAVAAVANETWYFQAWHRDTSSGGIPTSQFTGALGILFTM